MEVNSWISGLPKGGGMIPWLAMIAVAINGWNRLAIAFRSEAGTYQPRPQEPKRTP